MAFTRRTKKTPKTFEDVAAQVAEEVAAISAPTPEVTTPAAVPPLAEFILVKAVKSNQYEPFQRIAIPTDHGVPVKRSNWVTAQLQAGVIIFA